MFRPKAHQEIKIAGKVYQFQEHPAAPGYAFGQEGRAATVYHLRCVAGPGDPIALKVFKPQHRVPSLVSQSRKTQQWAQLPGMLVCSRQVLTPSEHEALLKGEKDLTYAVMMPWVDGPNWMEILAEKRALDRPTTSRMARSLTGVLTALEQNGLAHCDLSAANLLFPELVQQGTGVQLVDIEQLYGPGLDRPENLTAGSPGYAANAPDEQFWSKHTDRFAGALLLVEILCWSDSRVRDAASLESYFEQSELFQEGPKQKTLTIVLRELWGQDVASLWDRAWKSRSMETCPLFADWLLAIPKLEQVQASTPSPIPSVSSALQNQLELAAKLELEGKVEQALSAYRRIQKMAGAGTALESELKIIIEELEREVARLGSHKSGEETRPVTTAPAKATKERAPFGPFPWKGLAAGAIACAAICSSVLGVYAYQQSRRPGQIRLEITPGDGEVLLDGRLQPGHPTALSLAPGTHRFEIRRVAYASLSQTREIVAGSNSTLSVTLKPLPVNVHLILHPTPLDLKIGERSLPNSKNGDFIQLEPGTYEVRGTGKDYQFASTSLKVEAAKPVNLSLSLKKAKYDLTVVSSAKPATIAVYEQNGIELLSAVEKTGKHVFNSSLPSGRYKVKVSAPGFKNWNDLVTIRPGQKGTQVSAILAPLPQEVIQTERAYVERSQTQRTQTTTRTQAQRKTGGDGDRFERI